ncbi:hypothetical protein LTR28_003943, partial [Elasticomyces elasticus]
MIPADYTITTASTFTVIRLSISRAGDKPCFSDASPTQRRLQRLLSLRHGLYLPTRTTKKQRGLSKSENSDEADCLLEYT